MRAMLDKVRECDEAVDKWLEPRRGPALDALFYGLSSAADHGLLWGAIGGVRAARRGDPASFVKLVAVLSAESAFTNGPLKACFRRIRPDDGTKVDDPLPYGMHRPITTSFPSGHAVTAFMAASVLSRGSRVKPAWFALAALVASSRVYVRLHHASDVAAGALLGLGLGRFAARALPAVAANPSRACRPSRR
jgi:membrane-associated phospholipid phosphatase